MGKIGKRLFELDTLVATQMAEGRMRRRERVELLDERTPGGVFGGPGYDRDVALSSVEEEEARDRFSMMLVEREALRAQRRANWAIVVSVCIGLANLAVTLLMTIGGRYR